MGSIGVDELPKGMPQCLDGLKFVVTGIMDHFGREQIDNLVLQYGGKIMTAISAKTDFLLVGVLLEDGMCVYICLCMYIYRLTSC
jgi:BRCT domain type II-containing protein